MLRISRFCSSHILHIEINGMVFIKFCLLKILSSYLEFWHARKPYGEKWKREDTMNYYDKFCTVPCKSVEYY